MTSIAARLRYGFGSMVGILLLIIFSIAGCTYALNSYLQQILASPIPARRAATQMILSVRGVALNASNFLATRGEGYLEALEQEEANFEAHHGKVQELAGSVLEGTELGTRWREFSALAHELVSRTSAEGDRGLHELIILERSLEQTLFRAVVYPLEKKVADAQARLAVLVGSFYVFLLLIAILGAVVALLLARSIARSITSPLLSLKEAADHARRGEFGYRVEVQGSDEIAGLAVAFNEMMGELDRTRTVAAEAHEKTQQQNWIKTTLGSLNRLMQTEREVESLATKLLSEISPAVSAVQGVIYANDRRSGGLSRVGTYAGGANVPTHFPVGEGLVGQCARDKELLIVSDVPPEALVTSGLTKTSPITLVLVPLLSGNEALGVLELAFLTSPREEVLSLLTQLGEMLGIVLGTIIANAETREHLAQSQALAHDLQTLNQELRDKAQLLDSKNIELERKNQIVEEARSSLEEKAEQLTLTSKYKSQFLATMSHELRTPLNSLLILSRHLQENSEGNLTEKQIRYAQTINEAGRDLLNLITDILDLSKIESGTITLERGRIEIGDVVNEMRRLFTHIAETKGLQFLVEDALEIQAIESDPKRFRQIIKNLLSNAFKFTDSGSVRLHIEVTDAEALFSVIDSGIGIPLDKQELVFEAFQQIEADSNRRYGGTGLGLSISSELARRLGGRISLVSTPGKGSTFTLHLPRTVVCRSVQRGERPKQIDQTQTVPLEFTPSATPSIASLLDDRDTIAEGDQVILIVEDDQSFAKILLDTAHERGCKALVTPRGEEAMHLAEMYMPAAITLDILLADISGWMVLDRLKHTPTLRHIPVTLISSEDDKQHAYSRGAFSSLAKPVETDEINEALDASFSFIKREKKRVLFLEDEREVQEAVKELLENEHVSIELGDDGEDGIAALRASRYDVLILDLRLPKLSGFEVIEALEKDKIHPPLPVIVYTGADLSEEERLQLRRVAVNIILKDASSPGRLLAEIALFLHLPQDALTPLQRKVLDEFAESESNLVGKRVLLVDDDVRNLFALAGLLEKNKMVVRTAESGEEALRLLEEQPVTDVVLLDMMMPGMDGYETARRLRQNRNLRSIPVIAVTANVMKGDRERCLEAGASDYVPKPVDPDELIGILRGWLYRDRS